MFNGKKIETIKAEINMIPRFEKAFVEKGILSAMYAQKYCEGYKDGLMFALKTLGVLKDDTLFGRGILVYNKMSDEIYVVTSNAHISGKCELYDAYRSSNQNTEFNYTIKEKNVVLFGGSKEKSDINIDINSGFILNINKDNENYKEELSIIGYINEGEVEEIKMEVKKLDKAMEAIYDIKRD